MADLATIRTLGQTPIPGDKPGGQSVMLDADYEAMRAEVQKLDSVNQEPVDWSSIVNSASEILEKRSKNILAASYLTLGLFERHGYEGMAAGLVVCRDMIANFWEAMDPPPARKRGRIEAFVWLNERGGKAATKKEGSADKAILDECLNLLGTLQSALAEKLGNDAPGFGDLEREVKARIKKIEASEKAAEARREQLAKVAAGEVDESTTPDQARQILEKQRLTIHKISDVLRRGAINDPVPYRLNRAIAWAMLDTVPPNDKGVTQIPPPPSELSGTLLDLYTKGEWSALVESAESAFPNAPLWIDLQRWIVQGLSSLGPSHLAAHDAVIADLSSLLALVPELPNLMFSGGIPFASTETQKWLKEAVLSRRGGARSSGGADLGSGGTPEALLEAAGEARKLAARGQFAHAVGKMQEGLRATGESRGQFLWKLELARICLEFNQAQLAAPLLEELEAHIQKHQLEQWEPRLCLAAYTALLNARRVLLNDTRRATPELAEKTNQLHERIARLDLAAALSLESQ